MSDLQKIKERLARAKEKSGNLEKAKHNDTISDLTPWLTRIENQGNLPDHWLEYTEHLRNQVNFTERDRDTFINETYQRAIESISPENKKSEAYAWLLIKFANFEKESGLGDPEETFSLARIYVKRFAFVHVEAAQYELSEGNESKSRKILQKARDVGAQPKEMLVQAFRNLVEGKEELLSKEEWNNFLPSKEGSSARDDRGGQIENVIKLNNGTSLGAGDQFPGPCTSEPLQARKSRTSGESHGPRRISGQNTAEFKAELPDPKFSNLRSLEERYQMDSTVSFKEVFNQTDVKSRKLSGSASEDNDTVPMEQEKKAGPFQKPRPLRTCHSTPDCKNASMLSVTHSSKRVAGKPMRVKPGALVYPTKSIDKIPECAVDGDDLLAIEPIQHTDEYMPLADKSKKKSVSALDYDSGFNADTTDSSSNNTNPYIQPMELGCMEIPTTPAQEESMLTDNSSTIKATNDLTFEILRQRLSQKGACRVKRLSDEKTVKQEAKEMVIKEESIYQKSTDNVDGTMPRGDRKESAQQSQIKQPVATSSHRTVSTGASLGGNSTNPSSLSLQGPRGVGMVTPSNHFMTNKPSIVQQSMVHSTPQMAPKQTPRKPQEELFVNGTPYTVLKVIGKGGSSKVYEVLDMDNNIRAVKKVNLDAADDATIKSYLNEITLLQRLQGNSKVIKLYDYEYDKDSAILYVVLEKGELDLDTLFKNRKRGGDFSATVTLFYWGEMLSAVSVIHKEGIVHSDLKPANFLLVCGELKLIDFGIANAIQQDKTSVTREQTIGTLSYMSPEAIMDTCGGMQTDENGQVVQKIKIGVKSDVWSLGVILYNMVYGKTPFQHIRNQALKLQAICNPHFKIEFPDIADKQLLDVLKQCLTRDVKSRPSIDQLLEHPYRESKQDQRTKDPITEDKLMKMMQRITQAGVNSPRTMTKYLMQQLGSESDCDLGLIDKKNTGTGTGQVVHGNSKSRSDTKEAESKVKRIQRAPLQTVSFLNQP